MSKLSFFVVAVSIALMTPAPANAVTYDKLAYMTFSGPVQVPGVKLNAGTYRFRLANPDTSRNVFQVLSRDGKTVHAMFLTIPDRRTSLTDDTIVTFRETPVGVPPAVNSLFYGGEYDGYEFVYPKGWPIMVAEVRPQPEILYTPIAEPPVAAPIAQAEPVAEYAEQAAQPEPVELPRTASPLPLFALGGFASLVGGLGLGLLRRRAR